ncbi:MULTISPECIES: preprotein translocase subunit YajC [Methylomicrobium]|uniref:Sec translocon accessory complex subunit YajC n=1 Tax=Methylomicrobium album BG8 TaxID=686340 RepID=H8GPB2_METAL|nr:MULTISPECIES: preprotein translocase subunit YajC [Methylomicrobium]EIC29698.1 preprotein translocase, YajC subunit [Methylomicrobium album BG8]
MSFFISDAMAAAPAAQQAPGIEGMLFPLAILVFFYFMFLRPQSKRAKEKKEMLAKMQKGAEVVTSGGILGKVVDLDENFVRIEVSENTFIQVQRQSIESIMPKGTYKAITKKISTHKP